LATVYNGVDAEFWNASNVDSGRVGDLRAKLGIEDKKSILYFGRPGVSKGLEYVIEAIPKVLKSVPDFHAVLIVS
jgi:glycosyltransferase involved in cell wall biosynthesis